MAAFPRLGSDLRCDVAVVGGGITGALIADELQCAGHDVVVLEQRDVAWGSTAASTALLQYEIDTHMVDLAKRYGEEAAVLAYRSCVRAIARLRALARGLGDVDFASMESLYYASRRSDRRALEDEFALRRRHRFDVAWLEAGDIREHFGFDAPAAILSAVAARVDPYRMTHKLLAGVRKRGGAVHDRCTVTSMKAGPRSVQLTLEDGLSVVAGHVVMAAGYASERWLPRRVAKNRSSYAFVTDPIDKDMLGTLGTTMLWETARPYLYLRATGDGRLLVGGEDDAVDIPARRDARVDAKARRLAGKVAKLFPRIRWEPTFSWAGTFAETADGLPFFGVHGGVGARVLFAMAYGGNGITYSAIGAQLVRAAIERRRHPLAKLFSFERMR
jgi:glycine/D-amino acid oxidase-like deaminating enzyme